MTPEALVTQTQTGNLISDGDLVLLWLEDDVSYMVEVKPDKKQSIHKGRPLEVGEWIGQEFGTVIDCQHANATLLRPSPEDLMMKTMRESGIVYPKDAGFFMLRAGISPGCKVMEVGTGSGALSVILANAVGPTGHIHTYDVRDDLPQTARKNLTRAKLLDRVTFHQRARGAAFEEKDFDAVVLDIPTPWEEIENVKASLNGGGVLISLNPTYNQIERVAEKLKDARFIRIDACEILLRQILARHGRTRPAQRMVGHTEFIVSATKTNQISFNPDLPEAENPEKAEPAV